MSRDVFISYHKDSAAGYVENIAKKLEERGISCWYAHRDSEGNYADVIDKAISETSIFLFILNRGSDASPDCLNEVHIAHEKYKNGRADHIIVFRVEQCRPTRGMNYYLGGLHIIDGSPMEEKLSYLLNRIKVKVGKDLSGYSFDEDDNELGKRDQREVLYDPEEDLKETVKLAEERDPKAMYGAAMMYSWGIGTGTGWDYEKAHYWLKKVIATDTHYSEKAKAILGSLYYKGQVPGEKQSFEEAFRIRNSIDKEKYPGIAFRETFFMMANGLGCTYSQKDINDIVRDNLTGILNDGIRLSIAKYYIRTAQYLEAISILESMSGHKPEAEYLLGDIYHRGLHNENREPDILKAERHYRNSAEAGFTEAIWKLGLMNFHGAYGYKQDLVQARYYFHKGALLGHGDCQYVYAWFCKNAVGGIYDGDEAVKYLKKGAERGHDACMYELAIMYQQPEYRDDKSAFSWAKQAADIGETTGKFLMGCFYLMGRGCDCDLDKACFYLKSAVDDGYLEAEYMLEKAELLRKEGKSFYRLKERIPAAKAEFYGRGFELEEIDRTFCKGSRIVFLEGMGGIGKTELAKAYAKTHRNEYNRILFVTYESNLRELILDQNSFEVSGLERMDGEADEEWFDRKLREIHSLADSKTLIITDNYDTDMDPDFKAYIDGKSRMIFTTRNAHPGFASISVGKIDDEEALLNIFKANCGYLNRILDNEEKRTIMDIIHLVDCHTYTIELLARQMQASRLYPIELLERLRKGGVAGISKEKVRGKSGDKNLAYEHIQSVFAVSRLNEEEKQIMRLLSFQGVEGIPADKFKSWAGLPSYDVVNELKEKCWVREDTNNRLSLHPVVAEVMKTELKPAYTNCAEYLERMTDYIFDAWRRPVSENVVLKGCVIATVDWFQTIDDLSIDIWDAFVNFLWQVGSFSEAIEYGKIFYNNFQRVYGEENAKTAYAARVLGDAYFVVGDVESAYNWFERAVQYYFKTGERTEEAAKAYELLGNLYYYNTTRQNFALAEEFLNRTIDIREELINAIKNGANTKHIIRRYWYRYDLIEAVDYLAGSYYQKGRMYLAEGNYSRAVESLSKCEELRGEDYYDRSPSSYALVKMYKGICQYRIAKEMSVQAQENLEKSLNINLRYRGDLQIDTIDNREWLGDLYASRGEELKAKEFYQKVIEIGSGVFGNDSERIKQVKQKLSSVVEKRKPQMLHNGFHRDSTPESLE